MLLHTFAHEQLSLRSAELVQPQLLMQVLVMKSVLALSRHLELHTQPLTHPIADVAVDAAVSFVGQCRCGNSSTNHVTCG